MIGGEPLSLAGATLLNGYLVTAVTVCDVHRPTLCHTTPQVVPPALALAERNGADGRALISAIAAGLETTVRIGLGTRYPAFRARGWHSPGVIGPFGGAAAAGKLLGLDAQRQRHAFGLAGSQSAGTFAQWGTPTIKFHQSRGALSGLLAGLLAEQGFSASAEILAHQDGGIFNAYSDGGAPDAVTAGLGERWALEDIALRLWPAASSIQTVITSLFAGFAFARLTFPGRNKFFLLYLAVLMVPFPVTLVPLYLLMSAIGWTDNLIAIILPPFVSAYTTFLCRQYMLGLPTELEDAARIDGCNPLHVFVHVILPLCGPVIAATTIFSFLTTWNSFIWPLIILNSPDNLTLPIGLTVLATAGTNYGGYTPWTTLMAAATAAAIPMIAVYLAAQRYFLEGIAITGLKG